MAVLLLKALIEASIYCLWQLGELLKNTILFLRSSAKLAGQYWGHVTLKDSTLLQMLTDSSKMISCLHMELWLLFVSTMFSLASLRIPWGKFLLCNQEKMFWKRNKPEYFKIANMFRFLTFVIIELKKRCSHIAGQSQRLSHRCTWCPWKVSGVFSGIRTHDLCDAGAVPSPTELWSHSDVNRSICWALIIDR